MALVQGTHHITLSVGSAQDDWDFHTRVLGLRPVKKTILFDGKLPIYHLYYGNETGDASTLLTTFPFAQAGIEGRRGSNQVKVVNLAVPADALDFWANRLDEAGIAAEHLDQLGTARLQFAHPCGIPYALVGTVGDDTRNPWEGNGVSAEQAIRGAYGPTVSVDDPGEMTEFLENGMGARKVAEEDGLQAFELDGSGHGRIVELIHEPDVRRGTWKFGAGTVHHWAFDVSNPEDQQTTKDLIEGFGYTDVSERKDRQYFYSCYVRTPAGALFELAYSRPEGFLVDEDAEHLGSEFQLPPRFEGQREEIMAALEPIRSEAAA